MSTLSGVMDDIDDVFGKRFRDSLFKVKLKSVPPSYFADLRITPSLTVDENGAVVGKFKVSDRTQASPTLNLYQRLSLNTEGIAALKCTALVNSKDDKEAALTIDAVASLNMTEPGSEDMLEVAFEYAREDSFYVGLSAEKLFHSAQPNHVKIAGGLRALGAVVGIEHVMSTSFGAGASLSHSLDGSGVSSVAALPPKTLLGAAVQGKGWSAIAALQREGGNTSDFTVGFVHRFKRADGATKSRNATTVVVADDDDDDDAPVAVDADAATKSSGAETADGDAGNDEDDDEIDDDDATILAAKLNMKFGSVPLYGSTDATGDGSPSAVAGDDAVEDAAAAEGDVVEEHQVFVPVEDEGPKRELVLLASKPLAFRVPRWLSLSTRRRPPIVRLLGSIQASSSGEIKVGLATASTTCYPHVAISAAWKSVKEISWQSTRWSVFMVFDE